MRALVEEVDVLVCTKSYRVETIDMVILRCNNGVSGKFNTSKYCSIYCTG